MTIAQPVQPVVVAKKEISKVEIRGVDEKEVKISVDPFKLEARMVTFSDIENAIASENITLSGGNVVADGLRRNVRVLGEFTDPSEIEEIIISNEVKAINT